MGEPDRDGDPSIGVAGEGPWQGRARRRVVPWRALGLALVALVAIVGVARAAGVDAGASAGVAAGAAGSGWETVERVDGSASRPRAASDPGAAGGLFPTLDPVPPSSLGTPTPGASEPGGEPGGEPPGDAAPDWRTVLAELDARRVRALTEVDSSLLPTYAQPESSAWQQDAALLVDMTGRGLRPEGLTSRVLAVESISNEGERARLQLVDERSGYSLVDSQGSVVQEVAAAGPRRWTVMLVRLAPTATGSGASPDSSAVPSASSGRDLGWRVAAVVPIPGEDSP